MEITIDRSTFYGLLAFLAVLVLLGLGALGKPVTPLTETDQARLLTWDDWRLHKAERRYQAERKILRADADALAALLNRPPDPVAAQILAERINRRAADGEAALQPARLALQQASQDAAAWSAGILDRDTAVASLKAASALLK